MLVWFNTEQQVGTERILELLHQLLTYDTAQMGYMV